MSQLRIYNTLTRQLEVFTPQNGNKVSMYVCGPTVYDDAHLGHARCYITWDVISRYLRFRGYDLTYIRNITDVDDKIINKSKELKITPEELTTKYISEFASDMAAINVEKPDIEPKATEYIQAMIEFVEKLIKNGSAYVKDGDVYFKVDSYKGYGNLSNQNINDLIAGSRVDTDDKKDNPLDFALWKSVDEDEEVFWDSPWGKGRPGWHTECCVMIDKLAGSSIDIHAGGYDLVFPHHENERAQMEALGAKPFVHLWMHNGFVNIDSEKMSKSLGNFKTIKELIKSYDSNTIRFFILTNHYRMPVDFSDEALISAKKGVKRLIHSILDVKETIEKHSTDKLDPCIIANRLLHRVISGETSEQLLESFAEVTKTLCDEDLCSSSPWVRSEYSGVMWRVKEFIVAMDGDFNTSKAIAILFDLANLIQKNKQKLISLNYSDSDLLNMLTFEFCLVEKLVSVLGFKICTGEKSKVDDGLASELMEIIIKIRKQARQDKNWPYADLIRDQLKSLNIVLKDDKDGTTSWMIDE